jgi:hypothetical protein
VRCGAWLSEGAVGAGGVVWLGEGLGEGWRLGRARCPAGPRLGWLGRCGLGWVRGWLVGTLAGQGWAGWCGWADWWGWLAGGGGLTGWCGWLAGLG